MPTWTKCHQLRKAQFCPYNPPRTQSNIFLSLFCKNTNKYHEHTQNYAADYSEKWTWGFGKAPPNQPSSVIGHREYADCSTFYTGSMVLPSTPSQSCSIVSIIFAVFLFPSVQAFIGENGSNFTLNTPRWKVFLSSRPLNFNRKQNILKLQFTYGLRI